jgi:hypothetical protein
MIALLAPLIRDPSEPMWRHLVAYHRVILWSLKWTSWASECVTLDECIREQHRQFLAMPKFKPHYKCKDHNQLKQARNFLYNGPLRVLWAMKCEKFLREMKGYGTQSNFKNVPLTMTEEYSIKRAVQWATEPPMEITSGSQHQHDEMIPIDHPFHAQLPQLNVNANTISWHRLIHHQGLLYTSGKVIVFSVPSDVASGTTPTVAQIQGGFSCLNVWYLVVYCFGRNQDGAAMAQDAYGLLQVDCTLLDTTAYVLVPLVPHLQILVMHGIRGEGVMMTLVEEV